ncbi:uncharacterized protein LTR77_008927 [Saxophila tyrrhenica]|uniref:Peptidase A1 domain-containing protein n=1 Tax=Saxophila tyrrhenica TaxID=1690608 RepID=A0AAV9NZ70_9PEZI|nr:hypothetical protein LTR77_008927 [Saxophila tyrrhenica]
MHRGLSLLLLAVTATWTVAAPTKPRAKHSFKAGAKGHKKCSGGQAMSRAYRKYGWDIIFQEPLSTFEDKWPSEGYSDQQSSASPWEVYTTLTIAPWEVAQPSSAAAGYGLPSSSSDAWFIIGSSSVPAFPSESVIVSGSPASASVIPSGQPSQPWPVSSIAASTSVPLPSQFGSSSMRPGPASSSSSVVSAPAPSSSSPSGSGSDDGEVSATPEDNEAAYISPVTIGGQKMNLDFDTGSADLWVFSSAMPQSESSGHAVFNPSKSSTFKKYGGGSWQIQYGDGSTAQGSVGFDVVNVGGVIAQRQAIELAEEVSTSFLEWEANDGLLGLAFSSINTVSPQPQKTWFENVMDDLEQPLFTADLEEDASGTYEFGTIDTSKYTGEISYAPVDNRDGFWAVESQTYTVGGNTHQCQTCSLTIADTGTSLLIWDNDVVETYYSQVQGAQLSSQGYQYPCSSTLPDFGVAIGDHTVTVKGADMTYMEAGQGICFGGIQPNEGNGVNIIGDVLLKQYFAVFDAGQMRFGVAAKA